MITRGNLPQIFKRFREDRLENWLRYGDNTALFAKHFGSVTCMIYEDLAKSGLFKPFFDRLGIDIVNLPNPGRVRESVSPAEAMLLNQLKPHMPGTPSRDALAASGMIEGRVADYLRENAGADLWESQGARDTFVAKAQPQVDTLHQTFFPGRALLFPGAVVRRQVTPPLAPLSDALKEVLAIVAKRLNRRRQAKYHIPRRLCALAKSMMALIAMRR